MPKTKHLLLYAVLMVALIGLGVAGRLAWHPLHVAPVAATALLAGFLFRSRIAAVLVPLTALAVSDMVLGYYNPWVMASVYVGLTLPVLLGSVLRAHLSLERLIACSLASSVIFFLMSNGAEWWFGSLYTKDAAGLRDCFLAALPFFRNTLLGDLVYTAILFGGHGLVMNYLGQPLEDSDESGKLAPVRVRSR